MNKELKVAILCFSLSVIAMVGALYARYRQLPPVPQNWEPTPVEQQIMAVGGDTERFVGGFPYTIAGSGITSSVTSITVTSFTLPQNDYLIQDSDVSDTFYVTLEPGNPDRQEFASCTTVTQNSNGTATFSGCTRGLSPISPYTASTTLRFSHAGGSKLIFSNPPQLYDQAAFKDNDETITGAWLFGSTSSALPGYVSQPSNLAGSTTAFASVGYANSIANQGAATSTESNSGIVELATALQAASSTDLGADIPLVLQAKNATSSCAVAGLYAIISANDGKITNSCLDLTENYTWTGNHTWSNNASSTMFAVLDNLYVGRTGTTTIRGGSTASSTFGGFLDVLGTSATSTFAGGLRTNTFNAVATSTLNGCKGCLSGHKVVSASLGNLDGGSPSKATATATCPDGQVVTGGGINGNMEAANNNTSPYSYPSGTTAWVGFVEGGNGETAATGATVYAICVYP